MPAPSQRGPRALFLSDFLHDRPEQLVEPLVSAQQIQCAKQGLHTGGLGIFLGGGGLGGSMGMGIFAPAEEAQFLLRQMGQHFVGKFCLGRGLDQLDRIPMEILDGLVTLQAQIAAAQQFKHTVTHMGQAQIGDGIDLVFGKIYSLKSI